MVIVLISGKHHSGKSTLAAKLRAQFNSYSTEIESYAKPIRSLYRTVCADFLAQGITLPEKDRTFYHLIGHVWGRSHLNKNLWVDMLIERIRPKPLHNYDLVIIDDWRYPNEFECLVEQEFANTIVKVRVDCPLDIIYARSSKDTYDPKLESECALDNYLAFDLRIRGEKDDQEKFKFLVDLVRENLPIA